MSIFRIRSGRFKAVTLLTRWDSHGNLMKHLFASIPQRKILDRQNKLIHANRFVNLGWDHSSDDISFDSIHGVYLLSLEQFVF